MLTTLTTSRPPREALVGHFGDPRYFAAAAFDEHGVRVGQLGPRFRRAADHGVTFATPNRSAFSRISSSSSASISMA